MVIISDPPSRTIVRAPEGRRRRRPSGEPPPLPRQIGRSGRWWLASGGVLVARGEAIRRAAREQLGLLVVSVESLGLGGSAGSTPLRLRLDGESPTYVFAKLYARNHLRADRWCKLGRSVLYGSLEDEAPFETVRRLVQYEDYLLRLMRDAGLPTPTPYGVVVLTPEREYLVVCEFFDGAVELGDAQIDDVVIDDALSIVRRLWDAGLAHRDIKPSNLLLHDGRVRLIDVAFAEVRPSPWRQAVDLANMMLVLGLRANAQRFYRRALRQFRPEEIAEAFAASRGVTIPSQSRAMLRRDGRDLLTGFRRLAPRRRPVRIQRWGIRRFIATGRLLLISALLVAWVYGNSLAVNPETFGSNAGAVANVVDVSAPTCGPGPAQLRQLVLMAQAVPQAAALPCVRAPSDLVAGRFRAGNGLSTFVVASPAHTTMIRTSAGPEPSQQRLTVVVSSNTATGTMREVPSDQAGARKYQGPPAVTVRAGAEGITYVFPWGSLSYIFAYGEDAYFSQRALAGVGLVSREELRRTLDGRWHV